MQNYRLKSIYAINKTDLQKRKAKTNQNYIYCNPIFTMISCVNKKEKITFVMKTRI